MIKIISVTVLFFLIVLPGKLYCQQTGALISFNVQAGANNSVMIEWKIKQGVDTPHFEVERSRDQKTWERIEGVTAKSNQLYSFTDKQPWEGLNYYRVWLTVGKEGFAFTPVKWIQVSKTHVLYIWPNPANNMLYIKSPFVKGRIDIVDSGGKLIFNIFITELVTKLRTDRLSKGVYFIHVIHNNEILVEQFVKE